MECKKALLETGGDLDAAAEVMRKAGLAKADKRAGRVAADGRIVIKLDDAHHAAIVEINCETDFVARGADFQDFAEAVATTILKTNPANLDALAVTPLNPDGATVEQTRQALVAKIGENMAVRRFDTLTGEASRQFATYLHGTRIGVIVEISGGNADLGKDIAMHIAASRPVCVAPDQVPAELVAKEREIFTAMSAESGKPPAIIAKMVEGRVKKFLDEVALLGQPFVKDLNLTVGKLLANHKAQVTRFVRYEVGEGIEKKAVDFAAEVMAQVRGG